MGGGGWEEERKVGNEKIEVGTGMISYILITMKLFRVEKGGARYADINLLKGLRNTDGKLLDRLMKREAEKGTERGKLEGRNNRKQRKGERNE